MSIKAVVVDCQKFAIDTVQRDTLPASVHQLLECTVLASEIMPFDPMEQAFHRGLADLYPETRVVHGGWSFVHEYPLTRESQAMTHVWQIPGEREYVIATKSAPESVARLCRFDEPKTTGMPHQVQALAAQGMRVLAVATARYAGNTQPASWPFGLRGGLLDGQVRAIAFTCLVIGNLALIVANRSVLRTVFALTGCVQASDWFNPKRRIVRGLTNLR